MERKRLSQTISCGHCSNISAMESIGHVFIEAIIEEYPHIDAGTYYDVLTCPSCKNENIVKYYWADYLESEEDLTYEFLYPIKTNIPMGLPIEIKKGFIAAQTVKFIDASAYALLIRRLLELICFDRNANGEKLYQKLEDLVSKNEIPEKLVKIADGLRLFGNIGAHEKDGTLSEKELPILTDMIISILEYIYSAPYLASMAESKLNALKLKSK